MIVADVDDVHDVYVMRLQITVWSKNASILKTIDKIELVNEKKLSHKFKSK
jgi:hypothetical protein